MKKIISFCAYFMLLAPLSAQAQQVQPLILSLPAGQAALNISATEMREVEQDLLVANLRIENEDKNPANVQNFVNKAMRDALDEAKKYGTVKAATQGYNIYQYDKNGGKKNFPKDMIWKGQQNIQLKSQDGEKLLELAGALQKQGFLMAGLNYTLSPALAAQVTDEMMEAALEKLQTRAQRAAKTLGKSKAELREVNVQGNNNVRQRVYHKSAIMAMDSAESMAAPVASPGETNMSLTVSAKALLKP